ncbi:hypothetical protein [Bordetella holmesii]|uniref:Cupin domain protein n=2 Tax=Bordetella holmesii TaxID=35814 RepID=A0A158M4Y8_9BORD|nr:hypothetical protein [Bordetella holmesii]AHV92330.1 cupin region [Bordetella holmesii ATCC 51541]AIT27560.1 cupin region [Bordetella holmesii 44057]EWM41625.1 cupin region [Bordetella holmesii 41130]EWM48152.1 cupin region [Bordetella holmesii 35009]EWM49133.1 cupin region [Bordetella holmesii 70147]
MSLHHASPGELINLKPLGAALRDTASQALVRSNQIEVLRLILKAGHSQPSHDIAASAITLHCLEGEVSLTAYGVSQPLSAGTLVLLAAGVPHHLTAITDCAVLVTLCLNRAPQ